MRSGYRPKLVVFIDGLNDIIDVARSNFRIQDKIIFHGFSTGKGGETSFRFGHHSPTAEDFKYMLVNALPFVQAYKHLKAKPSLSVDDFPAEKDSFSSPFDWTEADFMFGNWPTFGIKN